MSPRTTTRIGERAAALAAHEARALVAALAIAPGEPAGVHEARKSLRRLRSLLALARSALGKEAVDPVDGELRALTKSLSALRDGQVVLDTAQRMARDATTPDEAANWEALLALLSRQQEHRLAEALRDDPGFVRRQALAHRQAERLRQLPWHRLHGGDLRNALARSVQRQERAQATALASGRVDDLHAWRRRSRRLRMQLAAFRKLRVRRQVHGHPLAVAPRHIAELVDQLGLLQDLALLQQALVTLEQAQARAIPVAKRRRTAIHSPIHPLT